MANARTIAPWNIKVPYALVEVEVNDGQASPADTEGFVATKMTRLDGTKEYPLNVADIMNELPKKYAAWKKEQQNNVKADPAELQGRLEGTHRQILIWLSNPENLPLRKL